MMGVAKTTAASRMGACSSSPLTCTADSTMPAKMASSVKRKRVTNEQSDTVSSTKKTVKRKRTVATVASGNVDVVDLTGDGLSAMPITPQKGKAKKVGSPYKEVPERRARVFRRHPPKSYLEKLARATTQRMFVIGRARTGSEALPEEKVDIVGTTGNIYQVVVGKEPTCTCPDARKGNQCKHIVYVLVNVLKAPEHLQYQLAFLSSELREIFQRAPLSQKDNASTEDDSGKRKPVDGDCPICFMEFDPKTEEIVWCKAACGNNVHKTCFQRWAQTQRANGVRCVYCRSDWLADDSELDLQHLLKESGVNNEGYVNVAARLGISGERDYSTYYRPWARRQFYYYG